VGEAVEAVVELVVTQDNHVVAQGVDGGILDLTAVEAEEDGALDGVASVDEDGVGVVAANGVVDGATSQDAAAVVLSGQNLAVCIVNGNEGKMLGLRPSCSHHCHDGAKH